MSELVDYITLVTSCYQSAIATMPIDQQPEHLQVRAGIQAMPDISQFQDECCEGLAYIRIMRTYPSADFPTPDAEPITPCGPYSLAVETELGLYRCFHVGTAEEVVGDVFQTAAGLQEAADYGYLYKAMCCVNTALEGMFRTRSVVFSDWAPFEVQGGCFGSRIQFITQLECVNSDC